MSADPKSSQPRKPTPLLSSHSIWILSGLMIGAAVAELVPESFRVSTCLGGIVGLISYFTVKSVTRRNARRDKALERRHSAMKLDWLVDRHISTLAYRPRMHQTPPRPSMERQYVTVASQRTRTQSSR